MNILLIRQTSHYTHPLMGYGIGIIGTILDQAGHNVKVIDNNSVYRRYSDKQLLQLIREFKPQVLGHGITMPSAIHHYRLSSIVKKEFPDLIQIAGGLHLKGAYEEVLNHDIDIACVREGEIIILPLIEHIRKSIEFSRELTDGLEQIDGISYFKPDGSLVHPTKFPILDDLDDVPVVDYNLFNLDDFLKHGNEPAIFPLVTQRGCPYKCTFCSDAFQRADKRMATAEWMFKNVKHAHDEYGAFYVAITDNNFALKKKRVVDFCHLMIDSGLNKKMRFSIQTKIESPMDDGTLALLKEAGLKLVGFGLERLDDYSQEMIQKKCALERIEKVLKAVKDAGLQISINMLIGFPFDTVETLNTERRLFNKMQEYTKQINCSILQPIPGTAYYDQYPRAIEWYLDKKYDETYRAHFAVVNEGYMEALIDLDFFELPQETRSELKSVYAHFNGVSYGKYFEKKTFTNRLLMAIDQGFSKASKFIFRYSPDIEFSIFRRVRAMRYYVATRLYGRRELVLGKVVRKDSTNCEDLVVSEVQEVGVGSTTAVLAKHSSEQLVSSSDRFAGKMLH